MNLYKINGKKHFKKLSHIKWCTFLFDLYANKYILSQTINT
ncbi:hypothetical protein I33_0558 [Bacillus subtilis subsp. subtilis str. RO-NN-1]|nr:hypothetical protein I33_0558 [Bacillus subtilis subsp. subtilis str. RO-NN-1]TWO03620.1 hypothetical protein CHCC14431_4080 [Bacillus licheniformis]